MTALPASALTRVQAGNCRLVFIVTRSDWDGETLGRRANAVSSRTVTEHIDILRRFLDVRIEVTADHDGACLVRVG